MLASLFVSDCVERKTSKPRNLCTGATDAVLDIMKKEPCGHVDQPDNDKS